MQKFDEVTDLPQDFVEERKEMWRRELQQIEQIRNDLLKKAEGVAEAAGCAGQKNCNVKRTWAEVGKRNDQLRDSAGRATRNKGSQRVVNLDRQHREVATKVSQLLLFLILCLQGTEQVKETEMSSIHPEMG